MFVFAVGFLRLASDLQTTIKRIKILIKWEWECLMLDLSQKIYCFNWKKAIKFAFLKVSSPFKSRLSCLSWWGTFSIWTCSNPPRHETAMRFVIFLDPHWIRTDVSHIFDDSLRDGTVPAPFLLFHFGKLHIWNLSNVVLPLHCGQLLSLLVRIELLKCLNL